QQGLPETPKPGFTRNQFGYSVGGPILPKIKDKMFFFSSTEWTRVRSNTTLFAFVPTPQFLAITAPNTQSFFNTFGSTLNATPTGETLGVADMSGLPLADAARIGATPIFRRVGYNVPSDSGGGNPQNTWSTVNRLDFNITDKTTLYGRYGLQSVDFF